MNNLKPYLPFGSQQIPWLFARFRNAWVAFVTAPNKLSITILDDAAKKAEEYTNAEQL